MRIFFYKDDYFALILTLSILAHAAVLISGRFFPAPAQVSVMKAPSSMEVVLVKEVVPTPVIEDKVSEPEEIEMEPEPEPIEPEPIPMEDEILVQEETEELVTEIAQVIKPEIKPIIPPTQPDPVVSDPMQGAIVEAQPAPVRNPAPTYPRLARQRGWEGVVRLKVFVKRDGRPSQVEVFQSSGYSLLDEAAIETVQQWQFLAARRGKITFSSWVVVPIRFRLMEE